MHYPSPADLRSRLCQSRFSIALICGLFFCNFGIGAAQSQTITPKVLQDLQTDGNRFFELPDPRSQAIETEFILYQEPIIFSSLQPQERQNILDGIKQIDEGSSLSLQDHGIYPIQLIDLGLYPSLWTLYDPSEDRVEFSKLIEATLAQASLEMYDRLDPETKNQILSQSIHTSTPITQQLVPQILMDDSRPERYGLALALWLNGDGQGEDLVKEVVEGDLSLLHPFSRLDTRVKALLQQFPDSRFARSCREYEQITGRGYYGAYRASGEYTCLDSSLPLNPRPLPLLEEEKQWRAWLQEYPDHPGADDAGYRLGANLIRQQKYREALKLHSDLLLDQAGDDNFLPGLQRRFLLLLDILSPSRDLEQFLEIYPDHPVTPIVQYALAVRLARQHRYQAALDLTADLALDETLDRYPQMTVYSDRITPKIYPSKKDSFIQTGSNLLYDRDSPKESPYIDFTWQDQRRRWQHLNQWPRQGTAAERYQLAHHWANREGWKNGYLFLYDGTRGFTLHQLWGFENSPVAELRQANHHTVALEILVELLQDPNTPDQIIENSRHLQILALARQFSLYPIRETQAIYPVPHVHGEGQPLVLPEPLNCEGDEWEYEWQCQHQNRLRESNAIKAGYHDQITLATQKLLTQFPQSEHGPTALLALFETTGDTCVAKRFLVLYPDQEEQLRQAYHRIRNSPYHHETQPRCGGHRAQILWQLPKFLHWINPLAE